jgi:hypothetical protein
VIFENAEGWSRYVSSSNSTNVKSIPAIDLADESTAATYLALTYSNYYWRRS